jgi:hypothetical protein
VSGSVSGYTQRLQFRAEAFNLPNRVNLAPPTTNNKLFDTKGAPVATPSREIQFGLKFLW